MWAQMICTAIGVWVYAAPSVLGYAGGAAAASDRIAGSLVITFSFIAIWEHMRGLRLANRPLGVWLIVAPWLLGAPTAGIVSSAAAGVLVIALSFVEGDIRRPYGGGWSALWQKR